MGNYYSATETKKTRPNIATEGPWNCIEAEFWRNAYMGNRTYTIDLKNTDDSKARFEQIATNFDMDFKLVGETFDKMFKYYKYEVTNPETLRWSNPLHKLYLESCQFKRRNVDLPHIRKIMELDFLIERARRNGEKTCDLDVATNEFTDIDNMETDQELVDLMTENVRERGLHCRVTKRPVLFWHQPVLEVTVE